MEFLHPDNVAGHTLLTLVARGSAIISELLRLSDHIPPVFFAGLPLPNNPTNPNTNNPNNNTQQQTQSQQQQQQTQIDYKYERILLDFRYLKQPEVFDNIIDNDTVRHWQHTHPHR